jgi:site-specific recombinase XerD
MGVKIRENRGKLYLDIYHKGTRKWESLGLTTTPDPKQNKEVLRLAEIIRSKRETQLVAGEYDLLDPVKGKTTLYAYMEKLAQTKTHKHPLRNTLQRLGDYPGGKIIKLSEVTSAWIERFKDYLMHHKKFNHTTAANYLKGLKQTMNKAVAENIIPRNPASHISGIKPEEPDRVFLNREEVASFSKTPTTSPLETEIKKAFVFSCLTGIRISDIQTLKREDIDHYINKTTLIKRQKKTGTKIYNPIPDSAWQIIESSPAQNPADYVFPNLASSKNRHFKQLAKIGERSGITKHISWHVARRTFAVMALENGADIYTVSKLLGHSNINTTIVYLKMTDTMSRKAIDAMPDIKLTD